MVTIKYEESGEAVSDFSIEEWLENIEIAVADVGNTIWERNFSVSTSLPIFAVKRAVAQGRISKDAVQFMYQDEIIRINQYGAILKWPSGFADLEAIYCEDILRAGVNTRKAERAESLDNKENI